MAGIVITHFLYQPHKACIWRWPKCRDTYSIVTAHSLAVMSIPRNEADGSDEQICSRCRCTRSLGDAPAVNQHSAREFLFERHQPGATAELVG